MHRLFFCFTMRSTTYIENTDQEKKLSITLHNIVFRKTIKRKHHAMTEYDSCISI